MAIERKQREKRTEKLVAAYMQQELLEAASSNLSSAWNLNPKDFQEAMRAVPFSAGDIPAYLKEVQKAAEDHWDNVRARMAAALNSLELHAAIEA